MLIFHKEEKFIIKPLECLLLGLPLIVIGIAGYVGEYVITIIIFLANIIRVIRNGERRYYGGAKI